jgi:hypothetical protein
VREPFTVVITKSVAKTPGTATARVPGAPTGTTASPAYTTTKELADVVRVAETAGADTALWILKSPARLKRLDADILESFIIYRTKKKSYII